MEIISKYIFSRLVMSQGADPHGRQLQYEERAAKEFCVNVNAEIRKMHLQTSKYVLKLQ